jgi:Immunity protein 8
MKLEIRAIWSPDLPSEGLPTDASNFDVFVQISIGEIGVRGDEVFGLRVCSATRLSEAKDGTFIHALVLESFSWAHLRARIDKLLLHASSCQSWASLIQKLAPYVQYSDG